VYWPLPPQAPYPGQRGYPPPPRAPSVTPSAAKKQKKDTTPERPTKSPPEGKHTTPERQPEGMFSNAFGPPDSAGHQGGPMALSPGWGRPFFPPGYEGPESITPLQSASFGASRPPSPIPQSDLYNMPLHSPGSRSYNNMQYAASPTVPIPLGFSPAPMQSGAPTTEEVHFPLPPLQGEGRARGELPRWQSGSPRQEEHEEDDRKRQASVRPRRRRS
jgi:hypothetical protein